HRIPGGRRCSELLPSSHCITLLSFKIQNRISVLGQKQSADNQVERLICDQFGGCEIGKSDIGAAGGDGFGRLINTVQLRLDAGELDRLKVKPTGIKFPDHPAPDVPIRREKKQCGQVTVRHSKTALTPVLPTLPMTIAQEKSNGAAIETPL